jgi:Leucine-rich repeat (LRR) protein
MSKIDQIEDINLSRNSIVSFPIFEAENLTKFDLSHNCLDCVSNLEQCSLPRLTLLDLSSNRIAGAIPVLFMPQLTTINIENNDIIQLMFLE